MKLFDSDADQLKALETIDVYIQAHTPAEVAALLDLFASDAYKLVVLGMLRDLGVVRPTHPRRWWRS